MKTITVPDDVAEQVQQFVSGLTNDYEVTSGTTLDCLTMTVQMAMDQMTKEDFGQYFMDMQDSGIEGWSDTERTVLYQLFNDMVTWNEHRR